MTRLTNAFSKKLENFKAAIGLHSGYYNLVKRHGTIRMTPALKAGVVTKLWSTADLVEAALSRMTTDVERLRAAIKRLHGCDSAHAASVPDTESFQGHPVWDGVVEVFTLSGHPTTDTCYAWSYQHYDGQERYFAVLKMPPVASPETAVRAAIMSELKQRQKSE